VQIDFTEGRLAVKLDPTGQLLSSFIALINRVLGQFSEEERKRIGIHTCPGGDRDSTHSADVDYSGLLPSLFSIDVGNFYMQLASEADRRRALRIVRENLCPPRRVFVGVIDPINPKVETPQEVRDRVLEACLNSYRWNYSERPTIAVFRPLEMIFPLPEKPPSQRFVRVLKEPCWRRTSLDE
jgi:5-methyltetrahydropteroyltriglutamate--homocysteine methyltransferase